MQSHIRNCGACSFYTAVVGNDKLREQTGARRRMESEQYERDKIQNEINKLVKSVNDLKRKMRFIKRLF